MDTNGDKREPDKDKDSDHRNKRPSNNTENKKKKPRNEITFNEYDSAYNKFPRPVPTLKNASCDASTSSDTSKSYKITSRNTGQSNTIELVTIGSETDSDSNVTETNYTTEPTVEENSNIEPEPEKNKNSQLEPEPEKHKNEGEDGCFSIVTQAFNQEIPDERDYENFKQIFDKKFFSALENILLSYIQYWKRCPDTDPRLNSNSFKRDLNNLRVALQRLIRPEGSDKHVKPVPGKKFKIRAQLIVENGVDETHLLLTGQQRPKTPDWIRGEDFKKSAFYPAKNPDEIPDKKKDKGLTYFVPSNTRPGQQKKSIPYYYWYEKFCVGPRDVTDDSAHEESEDSYPRDSDTDNDDRLPVAQQEAIDRAFREHLAPRTSADERRQIAIATQLSLGIQTPPASSDSSPDSPVAGPSRPSGTRQESPVAGPSRPRGRGRGRGSPRTPIIRQGRNGRPSVRIQMTRRQIAEQRDAEIAALNNNLDLELQRIRNNTAEYQARNNQIQVELERISANSVANGTINIRDIDNLVANNTESRESDSDSDEVQQLN